MTTKRKIKAHVFKLTVRGASDRSMAWRRVLSCFALRYPDGCEFILRKSAPRQDGAK